MYLYIYIYIYIYINNKIAHTQRSTNRMKCVSNTMIFLSLVILFVIKPLTYMYNKNFDIHIYYICIDIYIGCHIKHTFSNMF